MGNTCVAVVGVVGNLYKVGLFQSDTLDIIGQNVMSEDDICRLVVGNGYTPLNFSVDRHNKLRQDFGSFDRFHKDGVAIILAEYVTVNGKTTGYKLIHSVTGAIKSLRTADIVANEQRLGRPFLQNGIVRNGTVNCYPMHKYPVILLSQKRVQKSSQASSPAPVQKHEPSPRKIEASAVPKEEFTKEQKAEIMKCKGHGVDPSIIMNTALSPQQMRVIWVSKSKGIVSEAFNKPEYSVDVMKFYADRLVNTKMVHECAAMLQHPELTLDCLGELYLCLCEGINYSDLCDKPLEEINLARLNRSIFAASNAFDTVEVKENAERVLLGLKGRG